MKGKIFVLKRSNGLIGIYINGHKQENLKGNFDGNITASSLFNIVRQEVKKQAHENGVICDITFTENEESFKSGLPNLTKYLTEIKD